jgi:hypothetical protein
VSNTRGQVPTLGREYLVEFIARPQRDGKLPAYDPEPAAEFFARLVLSIVLNRDAVVPDGDQEARRFAREHITPLFRLSVS